MCFDFLLECKVNQAKMSFQLIGVKNKLEKKKQRERERERERKEEEISRDERQ